MENGRNERIVLGFYRIHAGKGYSWALGQRTVGHEAADRIVLQGFLSQVYVGTENLKNKQEQ